MINEPNQNFKGKWVAQDSSKDRLKIGRWVYSKLQRVEKMFRLIPVIITTNTWYNSVYRNYIIFVFVGN